MHTLSADFAHSPLRLPEGHEQLLLHSCCAPCSGAIMDRLVQAGIRFRIFFYNPNIHPYREYIARKADNMRYAEKLGIPFDDGDYDVANWYARTQGLAHEPERGIRCTLCFDMRMERTAAHARAMGYSLIATSLGISRWKSKAQIDDSARRALSAYPDIIYWDWNWRKQGGVQHMRKITREENFYEQRYCGCAYSLKQTNDAHRAAGREPIQVPAVTNNSNA